MAALAMVLVGCGNGNGGDNKVTIEYEVTELTLTAESGVDGIDAMDSAKDIEEGKGFISGETFAMVKAAPAGSFIRVHLSGTANLNWDSIGAVGVGDPENSEGKRCDFKPKAGGTYYNDVTVSSVFALPGGATAEVIFVIVWGDHKITKVELHEPKGELPPADPVAGDFNIGNLVQNLADGVTAVEIEAKFGMSAGAITIWYEGTDGTTYAKSQTVPEIVGKFKVTFDVAEAAGFNAATGLEAGTLVITAAEVLPVVININATNATAFAGSGNPNFFYFPIALPTGFDIDNFDHFTIVLKLLDEDGDELPAGWHTVFKFVTDTSEIADAENEWEYDSLCQFYNMGTPQRQTVEFRDPTDGEGYEEGTIGGAILINGNVDVKFIEVISITFFLAQ